MKILIVEDQESKWSNISCFILEHRKDAEITLAHSYNSACKKLYDDNWDLIIIDISIPTFDKGPSEAGGPTQSTGGKHIIRRISNTLPSVRFIIITMFTTYSDDGRTISAVQIDKEVTAMGLAGYCGMLYYSTSTSDWKNSLKSLLMDS